jgi:1,4-alpha-glucan branching enzyme
VFNLTPMPRNDHVLGVPSPGRWIELLNSDAQVYGGSGAGNQGGVESAPEPWGEFGHRISVTLPPLSCLVLQAVVDD